MPTINDRIINTDQAICRYLDNINDDTRGTISQDILSQLVKLVDAVMLKFYSPTADLDINDANLNAAKGFVQTDGYLKVLYRFRNYLDIVAAHYTLDEDGSERLMLKYYDYLLETKNLVEYHFGIKILHNLDNFPLNLDTALQEYYSKIAEKIEMQQYHFGGEGEKYYIRKIKPFFVKGRKYYEVTFTQANDKENKANRVIAFTKIPVTSYYASKFSFTESSIEILGKMLPIRIITGWEVAIRDCEFKNFASLITGDTSTRIAYGEQRTICHFLTEKGFSLTEILDFPEKAYLKLTNEWRASSKTDRFIKILDKCWFMNREEMPGHIILRYLLFNLHNSIIKAQRVNYENPKLSNLYLPNGCIPFDDMPFIRSPLGHNPRLGVLFESIKTNNRTHELLARQITNNTEISGKIFTPISELAHYGDLKHLKAKYNQTLFFGHRDRSKIVIENGYAYINEYKLDTCTVIKKLCELSTVPEPDYTDNLDWWLDFSGYDVDCPEKKDILRQMFSQSSVAVIYGSAGVGKSTLINHISHFYEHHEKLFLAQTNPAIDNLRRRVTADHDHCEFSTVASFIYNGSSTEYELLVIDECSTVNNKDMVSILENAKFKHILLVGDTYQINSIRFGNWFTALRYFLPATSVFELTKPYRTDDEHLLEIWAKVRTMEDGVQEIIDKESCSLNFDDSLLTAVGEDEAVLCLNYDGLYGINNINRFLQESNPNPAFQWDVQQYKVGDPVLFLENNRFHPLIYNNMRGKIVGIEIKDEGTPNERIVFDIEVFTEIDEHAARYYFLEYLETTEDKHSVVRFSVHKNKSTDEDDDGNTARTIVPFQIAYAVSIHKAQGLEYSSVKVVITDEVDELITHNIFYTAITRAQKQLKIYWTAEVEKKVLERIAPRNIDDDINILRGMI